MVLKVVDAPWAHNMPQVSDPCSLRSVLELPLLQVFPQLAMAREESGNGGRS